MPDYTKIKTSVRAPKVTDRKLLQLKVASLKAPKPSKVHPWRKAVMPTANSNWRQHELEARKRRKLLKKPR